MFWCPPRLRRTEYVVTSSCFCLVSVLTTSPSMSLCVWLVVGLCASGSDDKPKSDPKVDLEKEKQNSKEIQLRMEKEKELHEDVLKLLLLGAGSHCFSPLCICNAQQTSLPSYATAGWQVTVARVHFSNKSYKYMAKGIVCSSFLICYILSRLNL